MHYVQREDDKNGGETTVFAVEDTELLYSAAQGPQLGDERELRLVLYVQVLVRVVGHRGVELRVRLLAGQ